MTGSHSRLEAMELRLHDLKEAIDELERRKRLLEEERAELLELRGDHG